MKKDARIFVAGHRGLAGGGIYRRLQREGFTNLITRTHAELDLTDGEATNVFFAREKPEYVFLAAARVGGILANTTYPVDFLRENLLIYTSVLHAAHLAGCKKTLLLGSSCIYPRMAPQPIREEYILGGPLEETNQWYAIAKIAGIMLGQAYRRQYGTRVIAAMPCNLYGPGDNFDPIRTHVLPALMRRFHEAKRDGLATVTVWGDGTPLREFLHVDDLADACLFLMRNYDDEAIINIGSGEEISIRELAGMLRDIVGFDGELAWDTDKPNGTPRKLLDVSRLADAGWRAGIPLREGVKSTYDWYVATKKDA